MPATQISFASFAASLLASVQDEPTDCTPPVDETAPVVVAHPVAVDGGECIPVKFVLTGHWGCSTELRDDFVHGGGFACDGLIGSAFGAGMDSPESLPSGSHMAHVCGASYHWRYAVVDGFMASRGVYA